MSSAVATVGIGTLWGGIIGSAVLLSAQALLPNLRALGAALLPGSAIVERPTDRWLLGFGILFILVVFFFPKGVLGTLREWQAARRGGGPERVGARASRTSRPPAPSACWPPTLFPARAARLGGELPAMDEGGRDENARLYHELSERLRATEGLLAVAQILAGSLDVPEVARRAVRELTRLLEADTSIFFSAADEHGHSAAVAGYHVPEPLRDPTYQMSMRDLPGYIVEGLATGHPVASADVATDPRFEHPAIRSMPIQARSILYTPVLSKGAARGAILSYWWNERHEFAEDEIRLAAGVANQLALALENARLYGESERRHRTAAALAETSRLLSQTLDVEAVAQRVVGSVRRLIGGTIAAVYRVDPASGALVSMAISGDPGPGFGPRFTVSPGVGAIGLAVRARRSVVTPDLTRDPQIVLTDDLRRKLALAPYRAALAVPLIVQDQVIGALLVGDQAGRAFTTDEVQLAQTFGDHAAAALENARLHEEKVILAHEEERRRITYDLHDGIAQLVVGAKQRLDTCHDFWHSDPRRAEQELTRGVEHLSRAIVEIRGVLRALRPTPLDSIGLVGAIRQSLSEAAREAGWTVGFAENLGDVCFHATVETAVFRIVQEALANALRHAKASRLDVELRQAGHTLRLDVRDNGIGFGAIGEPGHSRGLGLLSMRERATLLGGSCTIVSEPGEGTRICVELPLQGRQSAGSDL